jgi:hypothetical protein
MVKLGRKAEIAATGTCSVGSTTRGRAPRIERNLNTQVCLVFCQSVTDVSRRIFDEQGIAMCSSGGFARIHLRLS